MHRMRSPACGRRLAGLCRLEDRACPGPDELAGIPRRAAFDPGLDRGMPQLDARAELLRRPFITC